MDAQCCCSCRGRRLLSRASGKQQLLLDQQVLVCAQVVGREFALVALLLQSIGIQVQACCSFSVVMAYTLQICTGG